MLGLKHKYTVKKSLYIILETFSNLSLNPDVAVLTALQVMDVAHGSDPIREISATVGQKCMRNEDFFHPFTVISTLPQSTTQLTRSRCHVSLDCGVEHMTPPSLVLEPSASLKPTLHHPHPNLHFPFLHRLTRTHRPESQERAPSPCLTAFSL